MYAGHDSHVNATYLVSKTYFENVGASIKSKYFLIILTNTLCGKARRMVSDGLTCCITSTQRDGLWPVLINVRCGNSSVSIFMANQPVAFVFSVEN